MDLPSGPVKQIRIHAVEGRGSPQSGDRIVSTDPSCDVTVTLYV